MIRSWILHKYHEYSMNTSQIPMKTSWIHGSVKELLNWSWVCHSQTHSQSSEIYQENLCSCNIFSIILLGSLCIGTSFHRWVLCYVILRFLVEISYYLDIHLSRHVGHFHRRRRSHSLQNCTTSSISHALCQGLFSCSPRRSRLNA